MTTLDAYRAGLEGLHTLGSILWFTIGGSTTYDAKGARVTAPLRVSYEAVEAAFSQLGLDPQFLPPRIRPIDCFRKATGGVTAEYAIESDIPDARVTLVVKEVNVTTEQVERHVIREIRDGRRQTIGHQKVAELKFFRGRRTAAGRVPGTEQFTSALRAGLPDEEREQLVRLIERAQGEYEALNAHLTSQAIRGILRAYLVHLHAVAVRPSGGIYFVSNDSMDVVIKLQDFVSGLGPGCALHQLPLVDTTEQRDMLTDAYQTEVEDDVRELMRDIVAYQEKNADRVSGAKYAEFNVRYQAILERSDAYSSELGLAQERAAGALGTASMVLGELANHIDVRKR